MSNLPSYTREEHISALIESVSVYNEQYHCGLVELVAIEGDVVNVKLGGA